MSLGVFALVVRRLRVDCSGCCRPRSCRRKIRATCSLPYFLPDSASLDRTGAVGRQAADVIEQESGSRERLAGRRLQPDRLADEDELRPAVRRAQGLRGARLAALSADAVIQEARREFAAIRGGLVVPVNPPAIPGLGVTAGFQIWIEQKGAGNYGQLADVVDKIIAKARTRQELAGVNDDDPRERPAAARRRRSREGRGARRAGAGCLQHAADDVRLAVRRPVPEGLAPLSGRSAGRTAIPDDAGRHRPLLRQEQRRRDDSAVGARHDRSTSSAPTSSPASTTIRRSRSTARRRAGVSSGQALAAMREVVEETLPSSYGYDWSGEAREEVSSGSTSALAFVFGLIFVFLILAAQYESWSLPVGVMMAVPFAILGALVAIALRGIRQRPVLPDRPADADRPGREERDPDRRIRGGTAREGRQVVSSTRRSKRRGCGCARSS